MNMKRVFLSAIAAMALVFPNAATARNMPVIHPSGPVMKPVRAVLAAMANRNSAGVAGLYSNDATVADDQAPFQWTGADAGENWLSSVTDRWGKWRLAQFKPIAIPSDIAWAKDTAYVVVPGTLVGTVPGKPYHQSGAFTFTLRKAGNDWKIASQTWTAYWPR